MYIFDIQISEVKYSTSTKKYLLKDNNYQKYKEYLMTLFFTYLNDNNEAIKKVGINQFFYNCKSYIVKYDKASVSYSNITNEFIFSTPYEFAINRNDHYKLEVFGESYQTIFIKTDYK